MFAARILVILTPPLDAKSAAQTLTRAVAAAARPAVLRFALPASLQDSVTPQADAQPPLFYADTQSLSDLTAQLTEETHFLLLSGAAAFAPKWDLLLQNMLRSLPKKRALLTGSVTPASAPQAAELPVPADAGGLQTLRQSLPALRKRLRAAQQEASASPIMPAAAISSDPHAPIQPEACLPALKESTDENAVTIGRGLALVCATAPVQALVIDPALLFGPVQFLLDADLTLSTLSLAAYVNGYMIYALHQPVLWPLAELPRRVLARPALEAMPGSTLSRFEQLLGFHYGQQHTSAKAAMGLFGPIESYAQEMPATLRLQQQAVQARIRFWETPQPMLVSAFTDLPSARLPAAHYLLRFGFLRRLENLPLLLYTGGSQERQLRSAFPNTKSYPDNGVLPRTLLAQGMTPAQHFARSKPLLMQRTAQRHTELEHIAWVDMDILPHPVCEQAMPSFKGLTDDRIHLATVNGVPDLSFFIIPAKLLERVAREVLSITQLDAELKRGLSEELMWERMFVKRPEWFAIHPMPRKRLFFLSLFDKRLLSQSLQPLMNDLPAPFLGAAKDSERAARALKRQEAKSKGADFV